MIKVYNLKNEKQVDKIYIFKKSSLDLNKIFKTNPLHDEFLELSKDEKTKYKDKVVFVNNYIHQDDTIETIKKKLIILFDEKISFEEIYLFARKQIVINDEIIFNNLTQNETMPITRERLFSFLSNISSFDEKQFQKINSQDIFSYNDIISLQINNVQEEKIPLGIRYNLEKSYPVYTDPFEIIEDDDLLKNKQENIVRTFNKDILLDYSILDNTIYLCTAENVFKYFNLKPSYNSELISNIYFPFLHKKNINTLESLQENKYDLLDNTKTLITKKFLKNIERVNLFYDIYNSNNKEQKINYLTKENGGIKNINFVIHPLFDISIPIDIIIKLVETNQNIPLIKYNSKRETKSVYRLFANKEDENNRKIPFTKRTKINKISNLIQTPKSIGIFYEKKEKEQIVEAYIYFYNNGNIQVKLFCNDTTNDKVKQVFTLKEVEKNVNIILNPILEKLNLFLQNSGFVFPLFTNFTNNVEILNIEYISQVNIKQNIILSNYINCVTSIFNIINDDLKKDINLDFKRVSNFNEMNSIDTYISRMMLQDSIEGSFREIVETKIIPAVKENFDLTEKESGQKVTEWLRENVSSGDQNAFENKKIKIKNNPGFNISIIYDPKEKNILIKVENINNINYLKTIPIYLDSLLRLTQNKTTIPEKEIEKLCFEKAYIEGVENIESVREEVEESIEDIQDEGLIDAITKEEDGDELELELDLDTGESESESESENESESESESESEQQEEKEEKTKVKSSPKKQVKSKPIKKKEELLEKDIVGMKLKSPYPFYTKLLNADEELFVKEKTGRFNSYNQSCVSTIAKHPVVLTEEEYQEIKKQKKKIIEDISGVKDEKIIHENTLYTNAFKYGSSPDKQHWYICPRFWCLKTNTPLTEKEVKEGNKCGKKVIPQDAKDVPNDAFIYEFLGNKGHKHHDEQGNYVFHSPGLIDKSKHPMGLSMPCCFKDWNKPGQKKRRDEAKETGHLSEIEDIDKKDDNKLKKFEQSKLTQEYVKEPTKFPLEKGSKGFLPLSVQKILKHNNELCQTSKKDKTIKEDKECLLRRGIKFNKNQSFLEMILDVYKEEFKLQDISDPDELKIFKEHNILQQLSLEIFFELQNGTLVDTFFNPNEIVDIEEYKNNPLYTKLKIRNKERKDIYFQKICSSYENFKKFINDKDSFIDYTYLWDFISKYLFKREINLVILELSEDDLTDKIEILCPTNYYSNVYFDVDNKDSLIIIKKQDFYEPVYLFKNKEHNTQMYTIEIIKTLFKYGEGMKLSLKLALKNIKNYLTKCSPSSSSKVYKYKRSIDVKEIIQNIKNDYNILHQILNYNSKIIGLVVENKETLNRVYIPCSPTMPLPKTKFLKETTIESIDSNDIWNTYRNTKEELIKLNERGLNTLPVKKVIEDELIVGIITETNQFIRLNEPEQDIDIDLLVPINVSDRVNVNTSTLLTLDEESERLKVVKNISLEKKFFISFRNTIKILLNKYENLNIKNELEKIINSTDIYLVKLRKTITLLQELTQQFIIFKEFKNLKDIEFTVSCINKVCKNIDYCEKINDECVLTLPKTNLINNNNNEINYYGIVADEIIRYINIRNYLFSSHEYLVMDTLNYNLHKNEIILLEGMIRSYFENISSIKKNYFIENNTWDTAGNKYKLLTEECKELTPRNILKKLLPFKSYKCENKLMFNETMVYLINDFTKNNYSLQEIKTILKQIYKNLTKPKLLIYKNLSNDGKKSLVNSLKSNEITFENMIVSEDYYFTNLDIILLSFHFKLPLIILTTTQKPFKENDKKGIVLNSELNNPFYYIIQRSAVKNNSVQDYSLYKYGKGDKKVNRFEVITFNDELKGIVDNNKVTKKDLFNIRSKKK